MAEEGFKRKLTAILSADVVGYSRLMRADEEATVRDLASNRVLITEIIQQHNGRVVDSPGDNILAEFASVVDAVNGAIKIQEEIKKSSEGISEDRRMEFRIGINLGDVIEEDERIYGDGVNIAARVEGLAAGGGIAISGTVYEHIKEKLTLGYHYLGEQDVKNISEPVRVYRLLTEPADAGKMIGEKRPESKKLRWAASGAIALLILVFGTIAIWNYYSRPSFEPASVEKMAFPLPEKPSIAVLPFDNMSGDPEQDYFSDGLTEELITALSKTPKMFVIARNSTFTYKGKPVKVKQVAEELGVRYVLEGSVRKAEGRVRITAQLIDAFAGHHVWAERYDRDLKDIFALQDEITMKVINALQVELTEGEHARLWGKGTDNLQAYLKSLRAREFYLIQTREGNDLARRTAEEAIALDPEYAPPYHVLSITHMMDVFFGTTKSPKQSMTRAVELIQKAIALDDSYALAHGWLGFLYGHLRKYEESIMEAQKGVALDPNGAHNYLYLCMTLRFAGRFEEAVKAIKKAIRLNPFPPGTYFPMACGTYIFVGRYEEAIEAGKKAVTAMPNDYMAHMLLTAAYSLAGRQEEARIAAEEVLRLHPKFSLVFWGKMIPFKNQADKEHVIGALRKAGLPEHPPLELPDKPSIAVLAFDNMSGDPNQEYFCDGIAEEIITALSKIPTLFVIARNSSFTYKGKAVKVQQVGRTLGVRYVLEGSVRKADDRVRITAQLVDAKTGNHLWAERYDRDLKDIFALQDEITMKIITALRVKLTVGEQARLTAKGTKNLQAYLKYLHGSAIFLKITKEDNALARQIFEEAIALDPEYAPAYQILGATYWMDVFYGSSKSPKESLAKALDLNQKAIALDDSYAAAHAQVGWLYTMMGKHEEAIAEIERAIELAPNSADAHTWMGYVLRVSGRNDEAIRYAEQGIRLNPIPPSWYFRGLALNYMYAQRYDEAITTCQEGLNQAPNDILTHVTCAAIYGQAGRRDAARAEAEEVLRINPKFSAVSYAKRLPYKNQSDRDFFLDGMRKAGLPE
jgi:adenylate cyclase